MDMGFPIPLPPALEKKAQEIGLESKDVEEHFIRGGGAGGQKINKTSSTVRLLHRPTGIEVKVQKHREQFRNRLSAWKLLLFKIEERVKGEESMLQKRIFKLKKQKRKRSKRAQQKVLETKKKRGLIKKLRSDVTGSS